jgi:hypothetical protein
MYFYLTMTLLCPIARMIVMASAPALPRRVPKVCRNECITASAGSPRACLMRLC